MIMWKIYFWLIVGLYLFGIVAFIFVYNINLFETKINFFSATYDFLIFLISIFSMLGFYGYVFKKEFLSKEIWKFTFLLVLIDSIGDLLFSLIEKNYIAIGAIIIFIPFFYALYKYAFKNTKVSVNG